MTTVGTAKYTYKLEPDWGTPPPGTAFGPITGVATDSENRVFLLQQYVDPPVLVCDQEGNFLSSWGNGAFVRPHLIHIADDVVYISESADSMVMTYTLDGKPLVLLGRRGVHSDVGTDEYGALVPRAGGPFNRPAKVVPGPSGDLYVADGERNCRVHRFSSDGHLVASWGEPGKTAPGQFHLVHGLLVDKDGRVYVCDRENSRVQVFTADGQYITSWTDLRPPCDVVVDREGVFYVSQLALNATHRYEGYPPPAGTGSALQDSEGRRTVLQGGAPQVSVLDRDGVVLASWDSRSGHGLCVDSRGDIYLALEDDKSVDKYIRQG